MLFLKKVELCTDKRRYSIIVSMMVIMPVENIQKRKKRYKRLIYSLLYRFVWSHLDLNQGPPDYESGALTN